MKLTTVPEYLKAIRNGPISQPDGVTCQSTCIAAAIGGETSIEHVRDALSQIGEPGDPSVMGQYLRAFFGDRYSYHSNASIDDMRSYVDAGSVLITHGWFTDSGHVICIDGVDLKGFRVMDPWEEFHGFEWQYLSDVDAFQGIYSDDLIYAACVAGESRSDAHFIYLKGEDIDRLRGGAWVHRIAPGVT